MRNGGEMVRWQEWQEFLVCTGVVCVHTVKYKYFFLMMFLCNSGSLVYGATVYSTTVTSDTVTGVHMQQACS